MPMAAGCNVVAARSAAVIRIAVLRVVPSMLDNASDPLFDPDMSFHVLRARTAAPCSAIAQARCKLGPLLSWTLHVFGRRTSAAGERNAPECCSDAGGRRNI